MKRAIAGLTTDESLSADYLRTLYKDMPDDVRDDDEAVKTLVQALIQREAYPMRGASSKSPCAIAGDLRCYPIMCVPRPASQSQSNSKCVMRGKHKGITTRHCTPLQDSCACALNFGDKPKNISRKRFASRHPRYCIRAWHRLCMAWVTKKARKTPNTKPVCFTR